MRLLLFIEKTLPPLWVKYAPLLGEFIAVPITIYNCTHKRGSFCCFFFLFVFFVFFFCFFLLKTHNIIH